MLAKLPRAPQSIATKHKQISWANSTRVSGWISTRRSGFFHFIFNIGWWARGGKGTGCCVRLRFAVPRPPTPVSTAPPPVLEPVLLSVWGRAFVFLVFVFLVLLRAWIPSWLTRHTIPRGRVVRRGEEVWRLAPALWPGAGWAEAVLRCCCGPISGVWCGQWALVLTMCGPSYQ
jgi:hypothetical protein